LELKNLHKKPQKSETLYQLEDKVNPGSQEFFKTFGQTRNTAPGGDREKLIKLRTHKSRDPSVIKETKKIIKTKKQKLHSLIDREGLRFDDIIKFKNPVLKKQEVANYENNKKLQDMRYRF